MGELVSLRERKVQVRDLIAKQHQAIAAALPRGMGVDRFARIVQTVVLGNDDLLKCEPQSLIAAILQVAAWGLEVDPVLGLAYLIPFKGKVKLIPGYRGLVELACRAGDVLGVEGRLVYERETLVVQYGIHRDLVHVPKFTDDRGPLIAVYAVADMREGPPKFEVMTTAEVSAIRKRSAAGTSGPWVTDFDAMALKTVIRRLCNRQLRRTAELARAIALDEQADRDEEQTFDVELPNDEPDPKPTLDTLTDRMRRKVVPAGGDGPLDVSAAEIFESPPAS